MTKIVLSAGFAGGLFIGVLVCLRLGWRAGRRRLADEGESGHAGLGAVDGAVFGLVGLLIAFTFTGAAARFAQRRQLISQQVNAIGTAWLRLDLVGGGAREELRGLFRRYLDVQLELHGCAGNPVAVEAAAARLTAIQNEIWAKALVAAQADTAHPLTMALLPPLNPMFDLEFPRLGLVRIDPFDRALIELRASMD
jgi:hypothetical protein